MEDTGRPDIGTEALLSLTANVTGRADMTAKSCRPKILVLLGETNKPNGELSPIARSRCDLAIQLAKSEQNIEIIPTGAFGTNFNPTDTPHGVYLTRYLIDNGIKRERILPYTNSSYTLEDAICARRIIARKNPESLIVVTSDFHLERVKFIFYRVFTGVDIEFHAATSPVSTEKMREMQCSEKKKLANLKKDWIEIPPYDVAGNFPWEVYSNASDELRHYDTISNVAVTAMVISFVYPYTTTFNLPVEFPRLFTFGVSSLLVAVFYAFYIRFAIFARISRKTMQRLEQVHGAPGFSSNYLKMYGDVFNPYRKMRIRFGTLAMVSFLFVTMEICLLTTMFLLYDNVEGESIQKPGESHSHQADESWIQLAEP